MEGKENAESGDKGKGMHRPDPLELEQKLSELSVEETIPVSHMYVAKEYFGGYGTYLKMKGLPETQEGHALAKKQLLCFYETDVKPLFPGGITPNREMFRKADYEDFFNTDDYPPSRSFANSTASSESGNGSGIRKSSISVASENAPVDDDEEELTVTRLPLMPRRNEENHDEVAALMRDLVALEKQRLILFGKYARLMDQKRALRSNSISTFNNNEADDTYSSLNVDKEAMKFWKSKTF